MSEARERVRLTERDYSTLRRTTETHREELVIRLCGDVGLRTSEIARLKPGDVTGKTAASRTRYFVDVTETDGGIRTAYMPAEVAHDFHQYVRSKDVEPDEEVVSVSDRRIQMLVRDVAARAAETTGRPVYESVTPSTLRHYFARRLLVEHGVDARVVAAVGGWQGVDSVLRAMDDPSRSEIATAFERMESDSAEQPGRLARIVTTLESVDEELISANSREEIDERIVAQLTDIYRAAWIVERDPSTEGIRVRAHDGESPDRFAGPTDSGIVLRALQTGKAMVAPDEPGPASDLEGRGLLGAVPVAHGETAYGALVVRSDRHDAFEDVERTALSALGRRIAFAITATERRLLLLGGTVLELGFEYSDSHAPLVHISDECECTFSLQGVVPGDDGTLLCFLEVGGTDVERVLESIDEIESIEAARLIQKYDDGGRIELGIRERSPLNYLLERGTTLGEVSVESGTGSIVCEVSPDTDVRELQEHLSQEFPTIELRRKRERTADGDAESLGESLEDRLTSKQRSVLEAAYHAGYFEWPRGSTAESLAESMGVSSPTLHNHLRKAQQKLLESLFEE
jgi:predicted DNA binding protein